MCNTAKVWCKWEQSCISSHSFIMTVKTSLEAPLFIRTKDNFRLIIRVYAMNATLYTEQRENACAPDKTWYHISTKHKSKNMLIFFLRNA